MHIAKNMEIIFIAALALASASALAEAAVPHHRAVAVANAALSVPATAPMAVVTITGKRLNAAQKAAMAL